MNGCRRLNRVVRNEFVYECSVVFEGRGHTGCFALGEGRVVVGSRQLASLVPGCDRLFWDGSAEMLVTR